MSTATVTARSGYCSECYLESVNRVCAGYPIPRPGGRASSLVPPLTPGLAVSVRKAAREIIEARGQGDASAHPRHAARAGAL